MKPDKNHHILSEF